MPENIVQYFHYLLSIKNITNVIFFTPVLGLIQVSWNESMLKSDVFDLAYAEIKPLCKPGKFWLEEAMENRRK